VDVDHEPEVIHIHLCESLVAQNAGIVHQHVHAAPSVHGRCHHAPDFLHVCDIGAVGERLTAASMDFLDHLSRGVAENRAVAGGAEIIDDDLCSPRGEGECMRPPEASARAGDDHDAVVKTNGHSRH
jgi:hypothetical protein